MVNNAQKVREAVQSTREVGGTPTDLTLTVLPLPERVEGWYEARRPQGTLHERVHATLWGFRTYVVDNRPVTECMVLPHDRNSTYGFVALGAFIPAQSTTSRVRSLVRPPSDLDLDRPF